MKLRLHGNSIRLRLNQAEVASLSDQGHVQEVVEFGGGARLAFTLQCVDELPVPRASFEDHTLRVQLPRKQAVGWAATNLVGISAEQSLGDGKFLAILVEKDFKCLHDGSGDPHLYPNPAADEDPA